MAVYVRVAPAVRVLSVGESIEEVCYNKDSSVQLLNDTILYRPSQSS